MKNKITKKTTLAEILKIEKSEKILSKHNVPCVTCPYAKMEMEKLEIGTVCKTYGIDEEKLLEELNKVYRAKAL